MLQIHHQGPDHPELSFYEATAIYAHEWILLKIEHRDDAWMPCGFVQAHAPNDAVIWTQFKDLVMADPGNATKYKVVYGGEYVREGPAMEAAARKFVEEFRRAKEAMRSGS